MKPPPPGPPVVRVAQHCWFVPHPAVDVHARVTWPVVHAVVEPRGHPGEGALAVADLAVLLELVEGQHQLEQVALGVVGPVLLGEPASQVGAAQSGFRSVSNDAAVGSGRV